MLPPGDIEKRCHAIRLDKKHLARLSKLSQKTVGSILRLQSDPRLNNLQAISQAVCAEEIRLRDYLNALHPLEPAVGSGEAAA